MRINSAAILHVKIAWSRVSKRLVHQDGGLQNGGNNCFGPMSDAGYLSVWVITNTTIFFKRRSMSVRTPFDEYSNAVR